MIDKYWKGERQDLLNKFRIDKGSLEGDSQKFVLLW